VQRVERGIGDWNSLQHDAIDDLIVFVFTCFEIEKISVDGSHDGPGGIPSRNHHARRLSAAQRVEGVHRRDSEIAATHINLDDVDCEGALISDETAVDDA
jgi:hypothetical protein